VVTRPLVAYYNYEDESDCSDEEGNSDGSGGEEDQSENVSDGGGSHEGDEDPFLLDEVDASLVIKLAEVLLDRESSEPGPNGAPSLHDRAAEIWPRTVNETFCEFVVASFFF
jgi:hypothetical protein